MPYHQATRKHTWEGASRGGKVAKQKEVHFESSMASLDESELSWRGMLRCRKKMTKVTFLSVKCKKASME